MAETPKLKTGQSSCTETLNQCMLPTNPDSSVKPAALLSLMRPIWIFPAVKTRCLPRCLRCGVTVLMRGTLPANKTSRRSKTVNLCPSAEQQTPDWHGLVRGTNSSKSQRAVWDGALIAITGRKEATASQEEMCIDDVPHPRPASVRSESPSPSLSVAAIWSVICGL